MWYVPSKVVLKSMTVHLEVWPVGLYNHGAIKDTLENVNVSPTGFKFTLENLQSRIKKKDSVTNVENAVLDFGVVDLLSCKEYTHGVLKRTGRPKVLINNLSDQATCFSAYSFQILSIHVGDFHLPTSLWVIRGSKTVSDTVLKHDLCKLVIAKVRIAVINDSAGSSKPSKERFQNFNNNSGIVGGERFRFDPFRQVIDSHEYVLVPS
ncbi:hypothetical protein Tco_0001954 [Tanacetum coccineum]